MKNTVKIKHGKEYAEITLRHLKHKEKRDANVLGYFHSDSYSKYNGSKQIELVTNKGNKLRYNLTDNAEYQVLGYVDVGNNTYVGYTRKNNVLLFLLLSILLISSFVCLLTHNPKACHAFTRFVENFKVEHNNTNNPENNPQKETGSGITDIKDLLQGDSSTLTLSVPQFSDLYITNTTYIPLMNIPENNVYILYDVYDMQNNIVFQSKTPIPPNGEDKWYLRNYKPGDYDFIIVAYMCDSHGNKGNSVSFNTTIHIIK